MQKAQYDLDRKAAKISALSSNNLDKYEYLTDEDLGLKPSTIEKARFEYSPLGVVLPNKVKKITNINKKIKDKNLRYNSQHSLKKFEDIDEFKELSLDSMFKKLNDFKKRFNKLKTVNPQTDKNKELKSKVLDNVGDFSNELYYVYKDKYNEEKESLNTKKKKIFTIKNRELLTIINTSLKKKKNNRLVKNPIKMVNNRMN